MSIIDIKFQYAVQVHFFQPTSLQLVEQCQYVSQSMSRGNILPIHQMRIKSIEFT